MSNPVQFGRTQVAPQATFGTAATTGFLDLETGPVFPPTQRQVFEMETLTGRNYARRNVVGRQTPEFSVPVQNVAGVSSTIPTAVPTPHAECYLWRSLLGNYQAPSGYGAGKVAASSTTTAIKIDSGEDYTDWRAGDIIIVSDAGSATQYAAARITAVADGGGSDHTLTVTPALPFTPAAGATVWATVTVYESATDLKYLTLYAQSLEEDSRMLIEGAVCVEATFSIDPGGQVGAEYSLRAHQSTADSGALTDWTIPGPRIPPAMGGNGCRFLFGGVADAVNSFQLTITLEAAERRDHNGAQGLTGWSPVRRMAELTVNRYVSGAAPVTDLPAATSFFAQFGSTPGNMFVINIPVINLTQPGEITETDGLWSQEFVYRADRYAGDTAGGSASANAAFCLAVG